LILDAIVRRVDPNKRDLNTFFYDEIVVPLGIENDIYLKLPDAVARSPEISLFIPEDLKKVQTWIMINIGALRLNSALGTLSDSVLPVVGKISNILEGIVTKVSMKSLQAFGKMADKTSEMYKMFNAINFGNQEEKFFMWANQPAWRKIGLSSAGFYSNAKTVAKILAIPANGGKFGGKQFWKEETQKLFMNGHLEATHDVVLNVETTFTDGGVAVFSPDEVKKFCELSEQPVCRPKSKYTMYGWGGAGGSLAVFVPELKLSYAYIMNSAYGFLLFNPRPSELIEFVLNHTKE